MVFLLIPHIVRESVLTDQNTRAIDTGTSDSRSSCIHNDDAGTGDARLPAVWRTPDAHGLQTPDDGGECGVVDDPADGPAGTACAARRRRSPVERAGGCYCCARSDCGLLPVSLSVVPPAVNAGSRAARSRWR